MPDTTFTAPDPTTFARVDELDLNVVGPRLRCIPRAVRASPARTVGATPGGVDQPPETPREDTRTDKLNDRTQQLTRQGRQVSLWSDDTSQSQNHDSAVHLHELVKVGNILIALIAVKDDCENVGRLVLVGPNDVILLLVRGILSLPRTF